jgi:hypothetical protein
MKTMKPHENQSAVDNGNRKTHEDQHENWSLK